MTTKAMQRLSMTMVEYREIFDHWPEFEQAPSEPERLLALLDLLEAFQGAASQWLYTVQERSFSEWFAKYHPARLAGERFGVCLRLAWDSCRAGALEIAELDRVAKSASKWLDRGHDELLTVLDYARQHYQAKQRARAKTSKRVSNEASNQEPEPVPGATGESPKRRKGGSN